MDLAHDYDRAFFEMHVPWRDEYRAFARLLYQYFPEIKSAVDFGCGNGYILSELQTFGVSVLGYDGSPHALLYADFPFGWMDLIQPLEPGVVGHRDMVLCLEVAEHLPPAAADTLMETLVRPARGLIVFSAAEHGYGGHLHLNEQPKQYWRDKFERFNYREDRGTTIHLAADLKPVTPNTWWFAKNLMILRNYDLDSKPTQL